MRFVMILKNDGEEVIEATPLHYTDFVLSLFESNSNVSEVYVFYSAEDNSEEHHIFMPAKGVRQSYDWWRTIASHNANEIADPETGHTDYSNDKITNVHRPWPGDDDYKLRLDQAYQLLHGNGIDRAFEQAGPLSDWLDWRGETWDYQ